MSRYLIIKQEDIVYSSSHGEASEPTTEFIIKSKGILSEEETLSKFKEVWDNGTSVGYGCGKTQSDITEDDWKEVSKDL